MSFGVCVECMDQETKSDLVVGTTPIFPHSLQQLALFRSIHLLFLQGKERKQRKKKRVILCIVNVHIDAGRGQRKDMQGESKVVCEQTREAIGSIEKKKTGMG